MSGLSDIGIQVDWLAPSIISHPKPIASLPIHTSHFTLHHSATQEHGVLSPSIQCPTAAKTIALCRRGNARFFLRGGRSSGEVYQDVEFQTKIEYVQQM
jgi:hypothetical protein